MSLVKLYKNGSYRVQVNTETGTKYYFGDPGEPEFPDSIDLKITDQCRWGCKFCYESSGPGGRHSSLEVIKGIFDEFPEVPIEVAVGGGNPLLHPDFKGLIDYLLSKGFIVNLTVNQLDLPGIPEELLTGISGLGVSIGKELAAGTLENIPRSVKQVVFHAIAGITGVSTIKDLLLKNQRVLVLGYKNMGRAATEVTPEMKDLEIFLKSYLHSGENHGTIVLDNLAVEQLRMDGAFLREDWSELWMGPEFSHSMFIDAVTGTYYPSSTDREAGVSITNTSLVSYFRDNHVKDIN